MVDTKMTDKTKMTSKNIKNGWRKKLNDWCKMKNGWIKKLNGGTKIKWLIQNKKWLSKN
jgi:hypothetical protein